MNARERLIADDRATPVSYSTPCREMAYCLHDHQCSRNASWTIRGIRTGDPAGETPFCTQHAALWLDRLS